MDTHPIKTRVSTAAGHQASPQVASWKPSGPRSQAQEKGSSARATRRARGSVLLSCDREWLQFPKRISLQSGGSSSEVKTRIGLATSAASCLDFLRWCLPSVSWHGLSSHFYILVPSFHRDIHHAALESILTMSLITSLKTLSPLLSNSEYQGLRHQCTNLGRETHRVMHGHAQMSAMRGHVQMGGRGSARLCCMRERESEGEK